MSIFRACCHWRSGVEAVAVPNSKDKTMSEDANSTAKTTASDPPVAAIDDTQARNRRTLRLSLNDQRPSAGRSPLFRH